VSCSPLLMRWILIYRWSVAVDEPTAGSQAMADAWLDDGLAGPGAKGLPADEKG
jgi:hypothetical protein